MFSVFGAVNRYFATTEIKELLILLFFRKKETKNSSLGILLQRLCVNLQIANFLGDVLSKTENYCEQTIAICKQRIGCTKERIGLERGKDGLGGYGSSEQQSIGRVVRFALSKRIEKVKRLQYAL